MVKTSGSFAALWRNVGRPREGDVHSHSIVPGGFEVTS